MARILSPYALCPLTERKRFLGVSLDAECGCIIVTLARNIVIRYRLSNQKQISSWSTKAMLSAPVTYDHSSKMYYGVFNSDEVSSWEGTAVSLGKLSKAKFIWLIHSIVSSEDCPAIIVYKNGLISPLKNDLANPKELQSTDDDQLLPSEETIKDAKLVCLASVHYVAISTMNEEGISFLHLTPVDPDRGTRSSVQLFRGNGLTLASYTIIEGDSPQLITFWSDRSFWALNLPIKSPFDSFGKRMCTLEAEQIDALKPSVLLPLGQDHIILYGATPISEGAFLIIISRQFGLIEWLTKLKVYDEECRMWTCQNNLVLVQSGYIVVAPFRLEKVKMVSLLGGNKISEVHSDEPESIYSYDLESIAKRFNEMKDDGHSEYKICHTYFKYFAEKFQKSGFNAILDNLSDIPDTHLIQIASYATNQDEALVGKILSKPLVGDFSSIELIRENLTLAQVLKLLSAAKQMIKEDDFGKPLLNWACLLCDADYMQCLLSKDEDVVTTLRNLLEVVEEQMEAMVTYRSLLAEINYFKRGKVTSNKTSVSSHTYFVEKIKLY